MTRACLALAAILLLAACAPVPQRPVFPDIRFTDRPPMRIDAASIDVIREFRAPLQPPFVDHLFPVTPERAMENWAQDRLQPSGTTRRVQARITDASVREIALPKTPGIRGTFTTDQAQRYDAQVAMTVDLLDERGVAQRTVSAKAARSQTIPEGITPVERDRVWYELTRALMTEFDQEMESQIRTNFGYLVQ
jgi:hypothetical protein